MLDLKPSELRPGGLTDAIRAEIEGLKQRGLPVELKTHGIEPVSTHEDNAVALYRIIQESLSNAFKHAKASQVIVDLIFGPDDAVVEISDNGVGFDTRARRLEANTSTTGFGMGVMHERAQVAGGELTVISARGTGTRVIGRIPYTLFSPIIQEQLPEPIMIAADALLEQGPCRVLLVDDHELVRRGTRALVEMADDMIVVGEAATGDGALTLAQELEPDIILMDIHMPSKGGIETTKELTVSLPQCKVILLTVYDDDDHVREGIRAGAKGYQDRPCRRLSGAFVPGCQAGRTPSLRPTRPER
jgi:CheY-like chemotaxis protein/anti-sigma regulatory factor (Ser/Thr protein kinase)